MMVERRGTACKPQPIPTAFVLRRYKDRSSNWKNSQSFSKNEMSLAIYVLQKAFEATLEKPKENEIAQAIEEQRVS